MPAIVAVPPISVNVRPAPRFGVPHFIGELTGVVDGTLAPDLLGQVEWLFGNLEDALRDHDMDQYHVVDVTILFVGDRNDLKTIRRFSRAYFTEPLPPLTLVNVPFLEGNNLLVQARVVAYKSTTEPC